jgi:uncharacterized coiled-coil DUF342 family protein
MTDTSTEAVARLAASIEWHQNRKSAAHKANPRYAAPDERYVKVPPTLRALAAERDKWHAGWMEAEAKVSELEAGRDALKAEVERLRGVLTKMRDDKVGFWHVSHFRRRAAVALQDKTDG